MPLDTFPVATPLARLHRVTGIEAHPTLCAQFFAWSMRVPLIVEPAFCLCEWPYTTSVMPGTSRAIRAATFSLGSPVETVS